MRTSQTPTGAMTQQQFNEMVQQFMPMFANQGEAGDPNQLARDHVAQMANMQEGRGGTAYRPQQGPQAAPQQGMQGMDGAFPARPVENAPIPQPNPRNSVDAMIDAQIGEDNFTGGTPNATPSLGTGAQVASAAPEAPPAPPEGLAPEEAASVEQQVQQMFMANEDNDIPQPSPEQLQQAAPAPAPAQEGVIDDAAVGDRDERSRVLDAVAIIGGMTAGVAGYKTMANMLREGNAMAIDFAAQQGIDPNMLADELEFAFERGGRTRGQPSRTGVAPIMDLPKVRTP